MSFELICYVVWIQSHTPIFIKRKTCGTYTGIVQNGRAWACVAQDVSNMFRWACVAQDVSSCFTKACKLCTKWPTLWLIDAKRISRHHLLHPDGQSHSFSLLLLLHSDLFGSTLGATAGIYLHIGKNTVMNVGTQIDMQRYAEICRWTRATFTGIAQHGRTRVCGAFIHPSSSIHFIRSFPHSFLRSFTMAERLRTPSHVPQDAPSLFASMWECNRKSTTLMANNEFELALLLSDACTTKSNTISQQPYTTKSYLQNQTHINKSTSKNVIKQKSHIR